MTLVVVVASKLSSTLIKTPCDSDIDQMAMRSNLAITALLCPWERHFAMISTTRLILTSHRFMSNSKQLKHGIRNMDTWKPRSRSKQWRMFIAIVAVLQAWKRNTQLKQNKALCQGLNKNNSQNGVKAKKKTAARDQAHESSCCRSPLVQRRTELK